LACKEKKLSFCLKGLGHFVDLGLEDPNTDEVKPQQEKLTCEITKRNLTLQLDGFDRLGNEIHRMEDAEHGEEVHRNDNNHEEWQQAQIGHVIWFYSLRIKSIENENEQHHRHRQVNNRDNSNTLNRVTLSFTS
jgi:hypothetical protein